MVAYQRGYPVWSRCIGGFGQRVSWIPLQPFRAQMQWPKWQQSLLRLHLLADTTVETSSDDLCTGVSDTFGASDPRERFCHGSGVCTCQGRGAGAESALSLPANYHSDAYRARRHRLLVDSSACARGIYAVAWFVRCQGAFVISGGREHTNPLPDVRGGVTPRALFGGVSRINYVNGAHVCWGVAFRVVDVALVVVRVDQPL